MAGARVHALAATVLVVVHVVLAHAATTPCAIQGKWNTQESQFQSPTIDRVTCAVDAKLMEYGPHGLLTAGQACPTPEQAGQPPVVPNPYLRTEYAMLAVPTPPTQDAGGVVSNGCACYYMVRAPGSCACSLTALLTLWVADRTVVVVVADCRSHRRTTPSMMT